MVEEANFEPHPASGELEVGDIERISYKRFDLETLKVQLPLTDWSLTALYLWCTGGDEGDGWRLTELLPYDSVLSQDCSWANTIGEANESAKSQNAKLSIQETRVNGGRLSVPGRDDDDDYWAQYDRSPSSGTPARQGSVNPQGLGTSEADYYARYADVQPAMDNFDPDEQNEEISASSGLNADDMQRAALNSSRFPAEPREDAAQHLQDEGRLHIPEEEDVVHISHPVPSSPSSRAGSDTVAKLESRADRYSASEVAIKQHIGYSVKSLYRLAKGAGIPRQEFEDMVHRELETLTMLDLEG